MYGGKIGITNMRSTGEMKDITVKVFMIHLGVHPMLMTELLIGVMIVINISLIVAIQGELIHILIDMMIEITVMIIGILEGLENLGILIVGDLEADTIMIMVEGIEATDIVHTKVGHQNMVGGIPQEVCDLLNADKGTGIVLNVVN